MENGAHALLMATAAIVFIVALSVSFIALGQAKATADVVLFSSDRETFQEYVNPDLESFEDGGRDVGFSTVVATIERCGHENFAVKVLDRNGSVLLDIDYAVLRYENNNDVWKVMTEEINKFIRNKVGSASSDVYRETFVEINLTGETYTGEDGTQLEENVGKKIYITFKRK